MKINCKIIVVSPSEPYRSSQHFSESFRLSDIKTVYSVDCSKGLQSFKWLGTIAAQRYSSSYSFHNDEFIPINITKLNRLTLFPNETIHDKCTEDETIAIELLGPGIRFDDPLIKREKTIWEHYAYSSIKDYVTVRFYFHSGRIEYDDPVQILGNFNGWSSPIAMTYVENHNGYTADAAFPPGTPLVFRFSVRGKVTMSPAYSVIHDTEGQSFHFHIVPTAQCKLRGSKHAPDVIPILYGYNRHDDVNQIFVPPLSTRIITPRVSGTPRKTGSTGEFPMSKTPSETVLRQVFDNDWANIHISTTLCDENMLAVIRNMLSESCSDLFYLFNYYALFSGNGNAFLNHHELCTMLKAAGIRDKRLSPQQIYNLFVNTEKDSALQTDVVVDDDKLEKVTAQSTTELTVEDDLAILKRCDYLECIVKLAIHFNGRMHVEDAINSLLHPMVRHAKDLQIEDKVRLQMETDEFKGVISMKLNQLNLLFDEISQTTLLISDQQRHLKSINEKEFKWLLKYKKIVSDSMPIRIAMRAFSLSQIMDQTDLPLESNQLRAEFLECIVRLAEKAFPDATLSFPAKITHFLNMIL